GAKSVGHECQANREREQTHERVKLRMLLQPAAPSRRRLARSDYHAKPAAFSAVRSFTSSGTSFGTFAPHFFASAIPSAMRIWSRGNCATVALNDPPLPIALTTSARPSTL